VTPFSAQTRNLRVADGIGQCFLPCSSNLTTWVAAAGGLPNGLCTFCSCLACANKFTSRVFRKSLCKIFLHPQWGKKDVAIQNGQVKQIEEEFLCPRPCAMIDRVGICHSISFIYIAHVAVIICHNLQLYGFALLSQKLPSAGGWWMFVKICTSRLSLHSMAVKSPLIHTWSLPHVILLGPKSCGMPFLFGQTVPQQ